MVISNSKYKIYKLFFIYAFVFVILFTGCVSTQPVVDDSNYVNPYSVSFEEIEKTPLPVEYESIVISPENTLPKLKAREFYEFNIGPYNTKYIVFYFANISNKNDWHCIEKTDDDIFKTVIQVPEDAVKLVVGTSPNGNNWGNTICEIPVEPQKIDTANSITKKDTVTHVVLKNSVIDGVKGTVYAGEFCKFDIGPSTARYCIISGMINSKKNDWNVIENDGSNYFSFFHLIPDNVKKIYVAYSDDPNWMRGFSYTLNVKKSKTPYTFKYTDQFADSYKKLKHNYIERRVIDFMQSIDARELAKIDPDTVIEKTVEYIKSISTDDFTTVKYLHDAEWYLVSYDNDSLMANIQMPQDYKTVLNRGLSVCEGFSNVFTQFCKVAGITEMPVGGYARGTGFGGKNWDPKDDPKESNHAWNAVNIDGYWYLLDVTWDCGHTSNGVRDNYYSTKWLFADPEEMIYSHYPTNIQFQLLEDPYTPKEFSKLPYLEPR